MLAQMTRAQFLGWLAYSQLEPFGEERADLRAGIVASVIANVNRAKGKAFTPADFMPDFDGTRKAATKMGPRKPLTDKQAFSRVASMIADTFKPGHNDQLETKPRKANTYSRPRPLPPGASLATEYSSTP